MLEGGVTCRDSCCVGVCWIVLKVWIVDRGWCTVGVVTALPVMLYYFYYFLIAHSLLYGLLVYFPL